MVRSGVATRPVLPPGLQLLRPLDEAHGRCVWLAVDRHLDRLVVVKRLSGNDRELRSVALLSDVQAPSLARIYGVHRHRDCHWLLCEFVDGTTLSDAEVLWPAGAVLPLMLDLLEAIMAMSDAGVVHCDISPGNVLVDANERARLVDYGIAARQGEAVSGAGTPGFAPPEAVKALCCDGAADLWSLAALGCWLLTLEAPYWVTRDDGQAVLILPAWRPADGLAQALWQILRRALALDPAARPTSADCRNQLRDLERLFTEGDRGTLRRQLQRLRPTVDRQDSRPAS